MSSQKRVPLYKVIVLGDAGVGKTSLLKRYVSKEFSETYKTTIGADFLSNEVILENGEKVTLQIWDTAGQERFHGLGNSFFRGANACVLVYDITNEKSFNNLGEWHKSFFEQSFTEQTSFPFVVVGNKLDQSVNRTVARRRAQEWAENHQIPGYFESSAKEATEVEAVFQAVAKLASSVDSNTDPIEAHRAATSKIIRVTPASQEKKDKDDDNVCC